MTNTIWAHLAGYTINEFLPIKKDKKKELKFRMIVSARPYVRESGDNYFTGIAYAEYEFGGKIIAEMAINGTLILIVDTGDFQFYIENGQAADTHQTNQNFGKFIKGKGRLTLGEYPFDVGVAGYNTVTTEILKVNVPANKAVENYGDLSYPAYLIPADYSNNDVQQVEEITDGNKGEAFFLLQYQLA